MNAQPPQCERVLVLLEDGCWHTTIEFVELGVLRASARVYELRRRGFAIDVRRVERPGGVVYAYRLAAVEPPVERSAEPLAPVDDQLELADDAAEPGRDEQPSLEERRRIAAAAREAFARSLSGAA